MQSVSLTLVLSKPITMLSFHHSLYVHRRTASKRRITDGHKETSHADRALKVNLPPIIFRGPLVTQAGHQPLQGLYLLLHFLLTIIDGLSNGLYLLRVAS